MHVSRWGIARPHATGGSSGLCSSCRASEPLSSTTDGMKHKSQTGCIQHAQTAIFGGDSALHDAFGVHKAVGSERCAVIGRRGAASRPANTSTQLPRGGEAPSHSLTACDHAPAFPFPAPFVRTSLTFSRLVVGEKRPLPIDH